MIWEILNVYLKNESPVGGFLKTSEVFDIIFLFIILIKLLNEKTVATQHIYLINSLVERDKARYIVLLDPWLFSKPF